MDRHGSPPLRTAAARLGRRACPERLMLRDRAQHGLWSGREERDRVSLARRRPTAHLRYQAEKRRLQDPIRRRSLRLAMSGRPVMSSDPAIAMAEDGQQYAPPARTVVSAPPTGQVTDLRNIHSSEAFFGDGTFSRRIV